jgi:hypothetical protein
VPVEWTTVVRTVWQLALMYNQPRAASIKCLVPGVRRPPRAWGVQG